MKWDDYGESSLTLLSVHCGIEKLNPTIPLDAGDFGRCIHLFECLNFGEGEIFSLMCIIGDKYNAWKPFRDNWEELTKLYNENNKKDFYELINKCKSSY